MNIAAAIRCNPSSWRRTRSLGLVVALAAMTCVSVVTVTGASAAIVPTVALLTAADYAVLGATTVTNTGPSTLNGSLGLSPGTSVTGFPPGLVVPPGTTDVANAVAAQAQADLTAAYIDAAGRPIDATTTADLANLQLQAGVYSGPSKGALGLTGPLTLDGAGNPNSVFIFQTDSALVTSTGSTVTLINGAQECNVFWQVGSSATLGTGSVFVGNILALTSISVANSVTVHGRALARNGEVTLDTDTFTRPTCDLQASTATTPGTTTGDTLGSPTATPTAEAQAAPTTSVPRSTVTTVASPGAETSRDLPRTGSPMTISLILAAIAFTVGTVAIRFGRGGQASKAGGPKC